MKKFTPNLILAILFVASNFAYAQTARVQIIHNSADAAAAVVDIYINGTLLYDDFTFRTATPFADVPAGVPLIVDLAPGTSSSVAESIYNTTVSFAANETYVVVANGIVSPTGYVPYQPFELTVYAQGREVANNPGNTDLLICHGATDAPTYDIVNTTTLPIETIVDNLSYPTFNSNYIEVPTGNYTFDVTNQTGATVIASYDVLLQRLGLQGQAVTIVASGFVHPSLNSNGPNFGLWLALPTGGNLIPLVLTNSVRVQLIHNSPDVSVQMVDVYIDGQLILDDFAFRTATPFLDLNAGTPISIDIAPSTSTSVADSIYNLTTTFDVGGEYIVVANGIVSPSGYTPSQPFGLSVFAQGREAASNSSNTDILVNHGSPDAPTVDIVETSVPAGTIVDNISFPNFNSTYLELPTADYTLAVKDETGTTTIATYSAPLVTLGLQGQALTIVASGFLNPSQNSNGPALGLWVAKHSGGNLIPLTLILSAPTADATQSFCSNATLADVVISGANLQWYDAAVGGNALVNTTTLVDGTTYYASQTAGGFTSTRTAVAITVYVTPSAPIASATQSFCTSATISDLQVSGTLIQWYDAATGGNLLSTTLALANGNSYYASQATLICESQRTQVTVTITTPTPTPTGNGNQTFCNSATVANLVATGTTIQWYDEATGGNLLSPTLALVNGTTYYASQTLNACESQTRLAIVADITSVTAPSGLSNQSLCSGAILSDLQATGTTIQWYDEATGGNLLSPTLALVNGTTYYASQTLNACESPIRLAVTVSIITVAIPTGASIQNFNLGDTLANLLVNGSFIQWYSAATGGTPLSLNTTLVIGTTYYASQTINGCVSLDRLEVTVQIVLNTPKNQNISLNYFPNPVKGILTIQANENLKRVSIINIIGQTISTQNFDQELVHLDMTFIPTGTYFIKIQGERNQSTLQIIKE